MLNKIFTLCGCLLLSISVSKAQDTLVLNDGTLIKSKVVEITESLLKYKKYSNLDGPVYTIDKKQVLAVHYENGEQESFKAQEQQTVQTQVEEQSIQQEIEVPVADNNAELIAKYNEPPMLSTKCKISDKPAKHSAGKFGITKGSVLANTDIEINIDMTTESDCERVWRYGIRVKNKTDKNIYIDLGNCFAIEPDGEFRAFYDGTTQKSLNNGKTNGGAVNLGGVANALGVVGAVGAIAGGVTLGGSSQNSLTTTYTNERFVAIPPHGETYISAYKEVILDYGTIFSGVQEYEILSSGEYFYGVPIKKGLVTKGGIYTFNEEDSPYKKDYIITYSEDPNFRTYTKVDFRVFLQYIIGQHLLAETNFSGRAMRYVTKRISNYNPSMIIDRWISVGK